MFFQDKNMGAVVTGLKKRLISGAKWMAWRLGFPVLNPPHALKQRILRSYQQLTQAKVLVETGTYLGDMVFAQLQFFESIYSIELSEELHQRAKARFSAFPKVLLLQGDSGLRLKEVVKELNEQAVFWLDGHYSGGITARADRDCPVVEELKAILESPYNHVILIDDARLFNGTRDYPSLVEIEALLKPRLRSYSMNIEADVIVIRYAH